MNDERSILRRSEKFGEFAKAFLKARQSMGAIEKLSQGQKGNQRYMYADLPTVYAEALPALHKHGIVHFQAISQRDGYLTVTTLLYHTESDQWIEQDTSFVYDEKANFSGDPKELGLKTTHMRRYAFVAMIGHIAGGDDDEEKIEKIEQRRQKQSSPQRQTPSNGNSELNTLKRMVVNTIKKHCGLPPDELPKVCNQVFDLLGKSTDNEGEVKAVQEWLNSHIEEGHDIMAEIEKRQFWHDLKAWTNPNESKKKQNWFAVLDSVGVPTNQQDEPTVEQYRLASQFCRDNKGKDFEEAVAEAVEARKEVNNG